jgi:hypothetical protein
MFNKVLKCATVSLDATPVAIYIYIYISPPFFSHGIGFVDLLLYNICISVLVCISKCLTQSQINIMFTFLQHYILRLPKVEFSKNLYMSHTIGKFDVLFINITMGKPVIPTFVLKWDVSISCDVREASDNFCLKSVSERHFHPYFWKQMYREIIRNKANFHLLFNF